jgi:hypothetical protein
MPEHPPELFVPSEYPIKFAACRDLGHEWHYLSWNRTERQRVLKCPNCTSVRREHFDGNGKVATRRYAYPKDYLVTKGLALDAARELRERLSRLTERYRVRWIV